MRKIDNSVFIAEGARVVGDVVLGKNSSVWFNAVLRGDEDQITVGEGTNIVGAGSLVTEGTIIPDGSVALGRPARVIRKMTQKDLEQIAGDTKFYIRQAQSYKNAPDY